MKLDTRFIIKTSILYCVLSASFSLLGIFLVEKGVGPQTVPETAYSAQEVIGHITWGFIAGAASLSIRYFLLSGSFALLIDSDHLIQLLPIATVTRMSHSLSFGMFSILVMILVFGKKDYLLGATAIAGLLTHLSYDTFADNNPTFPIFAPFYNQAINFQTIDWIFFETVAVVIIGFAALLNRRRLKKIKTLDT